MIRMAWGLSIVLPFLGTAAGSLGAQGLSADPQRATIRAACVAQYRAESQFLSAVPDLLLALPARMRHEPRVDLRLRMLLLDSSSDGLDESLDAAAAPPIPDGDAAALTRDYWGNYELAWYAGATGAALLPHLVEAILLGESSVDKATLARRVYLRDQAGAIGGDLAAQSVATTIRLFATYLPPVEGEQLKHRADATLTSIPKGVGGSLARTASAIAEVIWQPEFRPLAYSLSPDIAPATPITPQQMATLPPHVQAQVRASGGTRPGATRAPAQSAPPQDLVEKVRVALALAVVAHDTGRACANGVPSTFWSY